MDDTAIIIESLKKHFPKITGPKKNDICYATQNRQDALKKLADRCDVILVVGSPNSSNSNRLREIAEKKGIPAYLIDGAEDINEEWFSTEQKCVGLTAGASAPEVLVEEVKNKLVEIGAEILPDNQGIIENVFFVLPKELRKPE
jgi:4-hydroxy-3-methylbut-2-enyl diphosphate reductase